MNDINEQFDEIVRRRGRPAVSPEDRRQTISLSLSPEALDHARSDALEERESLSLYVEKLILNAHQSKAIGTPAKLIRDVMTAVYRAAVDSRLLETSIGPTKISGSVLTDKHSAIITAATNESGAHVALNFVTFMHGSKRPSSNWLDPIDVTHWSALRIAERIAKGPELEED